MSSSPQHILEPTLELVAPPSPGRRALARVNVIRKEIAPRRGVALLIVHLAPADEETWAAMIGVAPLPER